MTNQERNLQAVTWARIEALYTRIDNAPLGSQEALDLIEDCKALERTHARLERKRLGYVTPLVTFTGIA
jgi:hypothetical protein